ncbi:LuxR C-terminal-related transcriptional regulator [Streptomyces sp. NPDC091217]|uniref:helix-turn-helix transcriptional regulator n=1 Tax=Streptomyces sp. NPDC091217 TaxID=3365975 RepID=UPI0037FD2D56
MDLMDLAAAAEVIEAPKPETLPRLSAALAGAIPHTGLAELITCPQSPFQVHGESPGAGGSAITIAEVAALRPLLPASGVWQGLAVMAGIEVPVVALSSARSEPGALLVLLRTEDTPVPEEQLALVQALWDLLTAHRAGVQTDVVPTGRLATSRAAAAARAMAISELGETHEAALTSLLHTLRDRDLDDTDARTRAIDLTLTALSELRARAELDQVLVEERASDAFERLTESLRRILRPRGVRLDLGIPGAEEGADRILPGDVVNTASAAVRAAVHASMEDQGGSHGRQASRIHVGWKVDGAGLRATVRDDGPGALSRRSFDARRVSERLAPLGGRLEVDAVPDWGTTVTIEVPLIPPDTPRQDPLIELGARELEVLAQLALGRRNRDIAQQLHISESTVKFHLAKIFDKLGVSSRGEAAALAHQWGAA